MQNLELCSIVSAHFLVVNGAKMFTRLVIMTMMAVLCSSAMAEMPEVSFYLRGTEEKDLMQDVSTCSNTCSSLSFVILIDECFSHLVPCLL